MKKKLRKVIIYDDYNSRIIKGGVVGTLTPQFGNHSARNGTKLIEVYESDTSGEHRHRKIMTLTKMEIDETIDKLDRGEINFSYLSQDEIRTMIEQKVIRIRKFTPRECFRLMGVCETDIDKIQASGVSQSQQYKMAGNSIVVDVLYHIFKNMFTETDAPTGTQLSLF